MISKRNAILISALLLILITAVTTVSAADTVINTNNTQKITNNNQQASLSTNHQTYHTEKEIQQSETNNEQNTQTTINIKPDTYQRTQSENYSINNKNIDDNKVNHQTGNIDSKQENTITSTPENINKNPLIQKENTDYNTLNSNKNNQYIENIQNIACSNIGEIINNDPNTNYKTDIKNNNSIKFSGNINETNNNHQLRPENINQKSDVNNQSNADTPLLKSKNTDNTSKYNVLRISVENQTASVNNYAISNITSEYNDILSLLDYIDYTYANNETDSCSSDNNYCYIEESKNSVGFIDQSFSYNSLRNSYNNADESESSEKFNVYSENANTPLITLEYTTQPNSENNITNNENNNKININKESNAKAQINKNQANDKNSNTHNTEEDSQTESEYTNDLSKLTSSTNSKINNQISKISKDTSNNTGQMKKSGNNNHQKEQNKKDADNNQYNKLNQHDTNYLNSIQSNDIKEVTKTNTTTTKFSTIPQLSNAEKYNKVDTINKESYLNKKTITNKLTVNTQNVNPLISEAMKTQSYASPLLRNQINWVNTLNDVTVRLILHGDSTDSLNNVSTNILFSCLNNTSCLIEVLPSRLLVEKY